MDYVKITMRDGSYIYLVNGVMGMDCYNRTPQYRAKELMATQWDYQRSKRLSKIPIDKKTNVWYNNAKR
jgi:hypothetical protein